MALSWWEALLLGIVQGITEWLPVSSSGHLVIAQHLLGVDVPVAFDLLLHIATLLAVLTVYWTRVASMARDVLAWRIGPGTDGRLALLLALATIPIAAAGLLFETRIEAAFSSLRVVGIALIVTGLVLASTAVAPMPGRPLGPGRAVLVGIAQALALVPGISRSGATMSAAIHLGLDRRQAADFAFLLSIPALIGATVLKAPDLLRLRLGVLPLVLGTLTAYLVGVLTLRWLVGFVTRVGLWPFAPYCILLGILLL